MGIRPKRIVFHTYLLAGLLAGLLAVAAPSASASVKQTEPPATCASGEALAEAGEEDEARKVFVKILLAEPNSACASAGLKKLAPATPESAAGECAKGKAFQKLERYADAEAAFKAGLEKNPGAGCATTGLEEVEPKVGASDTPFFPDEVAKSLPDIAEALGILALLYFAISLVGYLKPAGRFMRRFRPYRSLLAARLTIAPLQDDAVDGKPGAPFTARVKARMRRMRDEAAGELPDLDIGTASEEFADVVSDTGGLQSTLAAASDISDQTKTVAALLSLVYTVLPVPRLSVSGSLEPPAEDTGPGATMVLEDGSRLEAALALKGVPPAAGKPPTAPDYLELADPVAIWAQYEVARLLTGDAHQLDGAESWALVREGLQYYRAGDLTAARHSYRKAIQLNPGTWAAYLGAAIAEARSEDGSFERSIGILEEALTEIGAQAKKKHTEKMKKRWPRLKRRIGWLR